jgi:hypothetical protein
MAFAKAPCRKELKHLHIPVNSVATLAPELS